ncbi:MULTISPECIES: VOC family protein [Micrococcaceae]|uniref:VOC family protein n=1 Tax=unclassified Kocuria TaxID=2649579 RepID=UPI0010118265|nr:MULTISPECIES: VOC family protein [unclassified Kocuria]
MSALVRQLEHVCITVPKLNTALAFYRDVLGFQSVFETENETADGRLLGFDQDGIGIAAHHILTVGADPKIATAINLVEYTEPKSVVDDGPYPPMNHTGLSRMSLVVDSVQDAFTTIRSCEGAEIVCPPREISIQEPEATFTSQWFSFRDPFGVFITMTEPLPTD